MFICQTECSCRVSRELMWRRMQNCGGGGGMAERVCRLVLPVVCMCLPSEEGILNSWIGGLVAHPLVWG